MRAKIGIVLAVVTLAAAVWLGTHLTRINLFLLKTVGYERTQQVIAAYSLLTMPPTTTDDLVPMTNTDVPPYAVNVFFEQEVQASKIRQSMAMIKAAGFHFIKQEMVWGEIETPLKGQYVDPQQHDVSTWAKYDQIVRLAHEYGLQVIFRIDTSPQWARPGNPWLETPPNDYADYGDFVAAAVQRYKGQVKYYQIWNEPNLSFEWGNRRPAQPAEYARLLRIAAERARAIDPAVVILSASLAPTIENSDRATSDVNFLQGMYDAGAKNYFDILGVNDYGLRHGPDDMRIVMRQDVNFSRPILLREIMVRNGDAAKAMWAGEIGWDALPPHWTGTVQFGSVTRQTQAQYTVRAYQRAAQQWPWMDVMAVWHFRRVFASQSNLADYYFGMVGNNFTPFPLYNTLKAYATAPPILHRGYHQETDYTLHYSAGWREARDSRAVLGGYKVAPKAGASLNFDVDGSWLTIVAPVGPPWGEFAVTIDNNPFLANDLTWSTNWTPLDLHRPVTQWQTVIPIAEHLGPGIHHVTLTAVRGPVAIDAIVVDRESPQAQVYWQLSGLLIGMGALVVTAVRHRRGLLHHPLGDPDLSASQ